MGRWTVRFLAFTAALTLVLLIAGVGALARYRDRVSQLFTISANPADSASREEIADAFRTEAELTPEEAKEFQKVFDELGKAFRKQDGRAAAKLFDVERMLDEVLRNGIVKRPAGLNTRAGHDAFRQGLEKGLAQNGKLLGWDRSQIKRVRFRDERLDEAIVYVRHWDAENAINQKMRWWVKKSPAGWKIYDYEELNTSLRISTLMSQLLAQGTPGGRLPTWARDFQKLMAAAVALSEQDFAKAEATLKPLAQSHFPKQMEAVRLTLLGVAIMGQGRFEEALQEWDRAEAIHADLPVLASLRAIAFNNLEKHEQALEQGRKAIRLMGDDAEVYHQIGFAAESLHRADEAVEAYRAGLRDDPAAVENLQGLRRVLPAGQKAELADWLAKTPKPRETFQVLLAEAMNVKDDEAAEALADGLRKVAPGDPAPDLVKARLNIRKKKVNIGIAQFKSAIAKVKGEAERQTQVQQFLDEMVAAGKIIEGYRAAPDPGPAFRHLADELEDEDERQGDLRRLIAEHRQRQPKDPWLFYYVGQLAINDKQYDEAEKNYARAMTLAGDDGEAREQFRERRVFAAFKAGKALDAYTRIGPRRETFQQLAQLLTGARNPEQLQALLKAHRLADAEDDSLTLWDAELLFLREDYDRCIKHLTKNRAKILVKAENRWKFHDRLIRSLVRAKRFKEAAEEAETGKEYNRMFPVIVMAAAGDVDQTAEELARLEKEDQLRIPYFDPDLGKALRSEKFRKVRERFPDPDEKKEE